MVTTEPGSKIIVDFDIENTGDIAGDGQDITLTTEDGTKVTVDTLQDFTVDPGNIQSATLEWSTELDQQQGLYQLCIETDDSTSCVDVEITDITELLSETVYIGDSSNTLRAVSIGGTEEWTITVNDSIRYVSPSISNDNIYFGDDGGNVYSYSLSDQTENWTFTDPTDRVFSAVYQDGVVYSSSIDGYLYAINSSDGTLKWELNTFNGIRSVPRIEGNTIYIGSDDQRLLSIDKESGTENWDQRNFSNGVRTVPMLIDGTVVAADTNGNVISTDISTQTERWSYTSSNTITTGLCVDESSIYVGNFDGVVESLDPADGSLEWTVSKGGAIRGCLTQNRGTLYVPSASTLYALDSSDGSEIWSYTSSGNFSASPAVIGSSVIIGDTNSVIHSITDGTANWTNTGSGFISQSSAIGGATGQSLSNIPGRAGNALPLDPF